ncbi:MAG: tRNA adenosine(34) deaminase TadA [Gammaproteobacteria bacterium]|nr:tRNA adenosine(34) deaminase TadA [Gammaproteobacteria bacterium]MDE0413053.1 tRNA adenosine(34) deaminase TadA [Gammaproteobacteria bacterium]
MNAGPRPAGDDERYMRRALELAEQAGEEGEVPVGAVLVLDGRIAGQGRNRMIGAADPTAHAEMEAIREACGSVGNYRLPGAELFVTLEPCAMCAGALILARLSRVVFATHDPRSGAAGSVFNVLDNVALNHRCEVQSGLLEQQSAELLRAFFQSRR